MQILEDAVPIGAGQLIQRVDGGARIAGALKRPCLQQRRGQVGHRAAHRLGKFPTRLSVMLLLEIAYADHQTRNAIGVIDVEQPLGKSAGVVDIAIGEHGEKGAAEQIGIARIELQHVHVIGGGRCGVALRAGMPRGKIAAGCVFRREFLLRRRLNGRCLDGKRRRQAES